VSYPIISIVHHLRSSEERVAWKNAFYRLPEEAYLQSVDGFIFNSQTTRKVVEETIGKSRPYVVAFPAGNRFDPQIDDNDISARAKEDTPLKIVFLGSIIPRKNLHTLLAAVSQLDPQSYQLSIIGGLDVDTVYVDKILQQVKRLNLSTRVTFHGALNADKLKAILLESHVLALPSSYEGFGIAYLEGMGYALPAIGGKNGAAHEIITHDVDGFLVSIDDSNSLAAHLRELASDREKLVIMSKAARQRYLAHPTWDESMAKVRKFIWKITQTSSVT
jgi:glycosyltransferase involved in cell wall biosynthesis